MTSQPLRQLRRLIVWSLVALFGSLCLALFGCQSRDGAASASAPASAEMKVGGFRQITGTGFLVASAFAKKESGILETFESEGYGKRADPAHNLLFANLDDLSGRWLLPHNQFLIWDTQELPPAKDNHGIGVYKMTIPESRVARWLYVEVIKSDTNNNGKWDHEDRKAIAIVDPSAANYVEVITETDEILRRTMHSEDKFTVIYRSNAKLFIADIDLPQRQVTTKDLPAIP